MTVKLSDAQKNTLVAMWNCIKIEGKSFTWMNYRHITRESTLTKLEILGIVELPHYQSRRHSYIDRWQPIIFTPAGEKVAERVYIAKRGIGNFLYALRKYVGQQTGLSGWNQLWKDATDYLAWEQLTGKHEMVAIAVRAGYKDRCLFNATVNGTIRIEVSARAGTGEYTLDFDIPWGAKKNLPVLTENERIDMEVLGGKILVAPDSLFARAAQVAHQVERR